MQMRPLSQTKRIKTYLFFKKIKGPILLVKYGGYKLLKKNAHSFYSLHIYFLRK